MPDGRRETCLDCRHQAFQDLGNDVVVAFCKARGGMIVPHKATPKKVEFFRVPMECPRPDTEVVKREAP